MTTIELTAINAPPAEVAPEHRSLEALLYILATFPPIGVIGLQLSRVESFRTRRVQRPGDRSG
jgi:hypothetical protein